MLGCIDNKVKVFQEERAALDYCKIAEYATEQCPFLSSTYRCTKFDKLLGNTIPTQRIYVGGCYRHGT
jgi:hypothetical protein